MLSSVVAATSALVGAVLIVLSGVRLAPGDRPLLVAPGSPSPLEPDPLVVARAGDIRAGTVPLVLGLTMLAISADILHRRSSGVSMLRIAVIALDRAECGLAALCAVDRRRRFARRLSG